ncbi:NAD(P)/FAD-dependent oxidoreductase [Streptomyces sp. HPF1205]|uniref:FAD-dependent oxidoreductase n=1 Tax=Streptomyces sp. HPF1205 TaxID=2873262 RepID=UPI001CECFD2C|nr:FAD-dependent monooxygenase [Streptomyces sp. HPF1205]
MATSRSVSADGQGVAVVIGGGLAGLLAAWALRGSAERIVVVERDRYPARPDFRPGTPQGRHAHLVHEGGRRALEELMPGIGAELTARGARPVGMPGELTWLSPVGWMPAFDSGMAFLACTRPVLDHAVLDRVRAEPSIEIREGATVEGLLGGPAGVTGVRLRAGDDAASGTDIAADLVVDASGRTSRVPDWLSGIGCEPPPEERVDAGVAYASRLYRRPPEAPGRPAPAGAPGPGRILPAVYVQTSAPHDPTFGVLLPVEGDRWMVTVGGLRGAEPAPGEEGFAAQLAKLRDPTLRELVASAEPAGEVRGFRPGPCVRRHYERRCPPGLVAIGDAACTFNPVYGQGISTVAAGALALRRAVRRHGTGPAGARRARRGIAAAAANAWLMAGSEDVRFPATTGGPGGSVVRLQHKYLDRVLARAAVDPAVCAAFVAVMSLTRPPAHLFHPKVLWPVLRGPRS